MDTQQVFPSRHSLSLFCHFWSGWLQCQRDSFIIVHVHKLQGKVCRQAGWKGNSHLKSSVIVPILKNVYLLENGFFYLYILASASWSTYATVTTTLNTFMWMIPYINSAKWHYLSNIRIFFSAMASYTLLHTGVQAATQASPMGAGSKTEHNPALVQITVTTMAFPVGVCDIEPLPSPVKKVWPAGPPNLTRPQWQNPAAHFPSPPPPPSPATLTSDD